ncbi:hypothetical protein [Streptomyces sp. NBC_00887]|uniref:hypothetical protein n=1 Tax=Streptomyces sp. NBC_00887 TaxID=2975859 RepID=UPI003868083E|nr:hypothetical protein OG844_10465 [Streptomyces sp. NBC_00887]
MDRGGLVSGHGQGLYKFFARDHPPVQLDLRGLQHGSRPGCHLPQIFDPRTSSRFPCLQPCVLGFSERRAEVRTANQEWVPR